MKLRERREAEVGDGGNVGRRFYLRVRIRNGKVGGMVGEGFRGWFGCFREIVICLGVFVVGGGEGFNIYGYRFDFYRRFGFFIEIFFFTLVFVNLFFILYYFVLGV